jgi:hypothetical protein
LLSVLNTQFVDVDDEQDEVRFNGWWNMILFTVFSPFCCDVFQISSRTLTCYSMAKVLQKHSLVCTQCVYIVITRVKRKGIWSIQLLEWKKRMGLFFLFLTILLRMLKLQYSVCLVLTRFFSIYFLCLCIVIGRL